MKAVLVGKDTRDLVDRPIPTPKANEVLIKNVAVASNPKDWKIPFYTGNATVQGNDVAGYVEAVGEGVTAFAKGDKVAAFTFMRGGDRNGAYAEYSIAPANTTFHLGPETTFEDAAGVPLAFLTAAVGLIRNLGLTLPDAPADEVPKIPTDAEHKTSLLVYGAGSTVGIFVTQLAKMLDLGVIGVAGDSAAAAQAYGCDLVLNYRSPSHESELTRAVKEFDVRHAFDCVSEHGSFQRVAYAMHQNGGGHVTVLLPVADEDREFIAEDVKLTRTFVHDAHNPEVEGGQAFAAKYCKLVGEWLEAGLIKPQKVTIVPGGLAGVAEGLRRLQEGEVSGEKLVYRISETPGLEGVKADEA